jgi:ribosomal peptide maturation radical SAM protein 1
MTGQPIPPRVALVNMPLSGVERPSLGLGLLKAILGAAGIGSRVFFPNLWFLEYFGLEVYWLLDRFPPDQAVVDWLFGAAAFPDFQPDHDAFLAHVLRHHGTSAARTATRLKALRAQMPEFVDAAARRVLADHPRIVGCGSTFQQHVASLALLRRIHALDPAVITVLGGANCESVMGRTTHAAFQWVDFVVSGEADEIVGPLFQSILRHGRDIAPDSLPYGTFGPAHRRSGYPGSTRTTDGVPRAIVDDIRNLPLPDYSDYFAERAESLYVRNITPGLPMEFSRGCWWGARSHCTFCGLNGGSMGFRAKDPLDVANQMRTMQYRHDIDRIEVVDNIMDMRYFDTLIPDLARADVPLAIFFETKSNLKQDQVAAMAAAGITWVQPGIESLHTAVLKLIGKGVAAWNNVLLLKWSRQHGVRMSWNLIYGFPDEDDAWYAEMASWMPRIFHLQPGRAVTLRYDRYSPYFNQQEKYRLDLVPAAGYQYAYPLPPDALANQAYFFEDRALAPDWRSADKRPGLAAFRQRMNEWTDAWRAPEPPSLVLHQDGDGFRIRDTRGPAPSAEYTLSGLAATILDRADNGPVETRLIGELRREGQPDAMIHAAIETLIARHLVLRLDQRLIALGLRSPVRPLPTPDRFPGGVVSWQRDPLRDFISAL